MNATDLVHRLGRDLWHAVAGGPDEPPPLLRRAREATTPLVAVLVALVLVAGWVVFSPLLVELQVGLGGSWWPVVMLLSAGLLVLTVYRPLLAWRLAMLAVLYELLVAPLPGWYGYPFPPLLVSGLQIFVLLVVLFVVAASQRIGVAFWVWLLTGLAAWTVPLNGSPDFRFAVGRTVDGFAPPGFDGWYWYEWGEAGEFAVRAYRVLGAVPAQLLAVGVITVVVLAGQLSRYRSRARRRLAVAEEHGLVLAERARIARELHDVIAHHMSMIAVRAETAPYRLRTDPELPEPARAEFQQISHESRTALAEMRRMLGVLRSGEPAPPTTPQPGLTDLGDLVESARATGATITLEMHGSMAGLPAAADVSGYRIVQEALTNAARHAVGAPVRITLRRTETELSLSVRNQAGPPVPAGAPGHGLRGMRERAAALGGELRAGPTEDGGFEVSATLPLAGVRSS